jgi:hypothetical protein
MTRIGHADPKLLKNPHAARADQVAARLVTGEGGLVDECDPGTGPGQHQGGDAASWASADNDRVPMAAVHRASTSATASVGVAQAK